MLISLFSIIQFCRAYAYTMWPEGERFLTFIHMPGFQWALFLLLLLLNSAEWNVFVAYLEKDSNLQTMGKYSYGMYLLHHIGIYLVSKTSMGRSLINERLQVPEKLVMIVSFVYFLGWLWYIFLEKPIIVWANKACERLDRSQLFTHNKIHNEI